MAKIINNQNWPRLAQIRKLVIPDEPGHVLLEGDLSQAEARCVAWKAKEGTLMDLFLAEKKVHEYVGALLFGEPITKKTTPEKYETSKRIVHGSDYGMMAAKISEVVLNETGIAMSVADCKQKQNRYFQNFPRIKTGYHLAIQDELQQNLRVLKTPVGDSRKFYTPWGDELFRKAYGHYAQNIVAYITNQGLNKLYYDTWLKQHILMQVHDSIVLSVPKMKLPGAAKLLTEALTHKLTIEGQELVIPVELKTGKNWGEMTDYALN